MLRVNGGYEGFPIGTYKLHSEVEAAFGGVTAELLGASALGLQKPYGEQELGFAAGKIAELKPETDGTVAVTLSDGTQPEGVFCDSYIDTLRSGKATFYSFFGDMFTDQYDQQPGNGAYAIGDDLYVGYSATITDAIRGLLTKDPAKAKQSGPTLVGKVVGHVIQVPDLVNGVMLGFRWQVERTA